MRSILGDLASAVVRASELTSPCQKSPSLVVVLASPAAEDSVANSILTPEMTNTCTTSRAAMLETDEEISFFFNKDYKEKGGGGSDIKGDEINLHNKAVNRNWEEQLLHD